ncbi:MAG: ribulose-phosphate 3-epimerase [Dysgonamonadaceae bacterium]|nr:ribulose-phosphate 3-epimerase [Dysgonamonadaceae bacterium]
MPILVAPSVLSADFLNLGKGIEMINRSEADLLHLDVMDGVFVPNISIGFPAVRQFTQISAKPVDAHLMTVEPQKFITQFRDFGVTKLTVHYEACTHLHRTVAEIRKAGMSPGVALNPHTPVELLIDIIEDVDMVTIMSVNPGFGGQRFIPHSLDKVRRLRQIIHSRGLNTQIEIDGGVTLENARQIADSGADILVAGNAVFSAENPIEAISIIKNL